MENLIINIKNNKLLVIIAISILIFNVRNPGLVLSKADYNNLVNQLKTNSELKLKFQKDDVYLFEKR